MQGCSGKLAWKLAAARINGLSSRPKSHHASGLNFLSLKTHFNSLKIVVFCAANLHLELQTTQLTVTQLPREPSTTCPQPLGTPGTGPGGTVSLQTNIRLFVLCFMCVFWEACSGCLFACGCVHARMFWQTCMETSSCTNQWIIKQTEKSSRIWFKFSLTENTFQ